MPNDSLIKRLAKLEERTQADGQQVTRIELVGIDPVTHQPVGESVCIYDRSRTRTRTT